jgi:hypothetical protein
VEHGGVFRSRMLEEVPQPSDELHAALGGLPRRHNEG